MRKRRILSRFWLSWFSQSRFEEPSKNASKSRVLLHDTPSICWSILHIHWANSLKVSASQGKVYTLPPITPVLAGRQFQGGGGGYIFNPPPPGQNFIPPPSLHPTQKRVFSKVGVWWCMKFDLVEKAMQRPLESGRLKPPIGKFGRNVLK